MSSTQDDILFDQLNDWLKEQNVNPQEVLEDEVGYFYYSYNEGEDPSQGEYQKVYLPKEFQMAVI